MPKPLYRYNKKTLRYEQVRFSIWRFLGSFVFYLSFGILFFAGLNVLQNLVIQTEEEKSLQEENEKLITYQASIGSQLEGSKNLLISLKNQEAKLYEELFEAPPEKTSESTDVLPNPEDMGAQINYLQHLSAKVNSKAATNNEVFATYIDVEKEDLPKLFNLPSGQPVEGITTENLISGFGIRINPFHKGKYHHDGIDLGFTKGTSVLAAGNGKVLSFSISSLNAGLGNYIDIDHGNGIVSRYAHLQDVKVTWGQKIVKGQKIGTVGSSGGSAAPHLHFEIMKNGKNVNPMIYLVGGIDAKAHEQLINKSKKLNQSLD